MSMKIARLCSIYGTGVAISLGIVNLIYPNSFDWGTIIMFLIVSLGVYYYLEYRVIPEVEKHRKAATRSEPGATEQDSSEHSSQRRKRPKIKKRSQ